MQQIWKNYLRQKKKFTVRTFQYIIYQNFTIHDETLTFFL